MGNLSLPKSNELIVMVSICAIVALAVVWSSKNIDFIEEITEKKGWF